MLCAADTAHLAAGLRRFSTKLWPLESEDEIVALLLGMARYPVDTPDRAEVIAGPSVFDLWICGRPPAASEGVGPPSLKTKTSSKTAKISLRERHCAPLTSCGDVCRHQY